MHWLAQHCICASEQMCYGKRGEIIKTVMGTMKYGSLRITKFHKVKLILWC